MPLRSLRAACTRHASIRRPTLFVARPALYRLGVGRFAASWRGALCAVIAAVALPPSFAAADDATAIKWHPGHYMLVYLGDTPEQRGKHFDQIADEPTITGAQVRYMWAQLEPRKDEYDFSAIERDLAKLQSHGKRLVIQIEDRVFGKTAAPERALPSYLMQEPQFGGGSAKMRDGYVARLWEKPVMDREIALFQALGRRFDKEAYVEGIVGEETAANVGSSGGPNFTAALAEQWTRWVTAVRPAWPHTNVFIYSNFLGGKLPSVISACAKNRCGAGGPDVLPNRATEGAKILTGATGGVDYRGRMPIAFAVESPELGGRLGTFAPQELFDYAYGTLHVNYLFWMRNIAVGGPAQRWDTGILPFLRSINGKIHTECPSDFDNHCNSD